MCGEGAGVEGICKARKDVCILGKKFSNEGNNDVFEYKTKLLKSLRLHMYNLEGVMTYFSSKQFINFYTTSKNRKKKKNVRTRR